jgi:hypothetical protein
VDECDLSSQLRDGDTVICRTNAPLMSRALELIANGVKAVVRRRNIGASLASLARTLRVDAPTMAATAQQHGYKRIFVPASDAPEVTRSESNLPWHIHPNFQGFSI